MVITYYGVSCFKIQSGDTIIVLDPPSKKSGFKPPRFQADVVCISHNHPGHNGLEHIPGKEKGTVPFGITGPGEYEIKGVTVKGLRTFHDSLSGKKYGLNTVYNFVFDKINICHLGDFGEKELRPELQESLGEVDILFVPINGAIIAAEQAVKIINQIEPKVVIPMHYFTKSFKVDKKCLSAFLKEIGQEKVTPVEKFTFRKREISDKKQEVVVLTPALN
jgi:L-ascorbate metabolism protein UlaG (beta-lactamase superfamily)